MESLSTISSVMSQWLLGFVVGIICFIAACSTRPSPECAAFRELSRNQRLVEFVDFPVEKQIDMYLCAMGQAPADRGLAYAIAERGVAAVPPLLERLENASDEGVQEDLIYVFEVISQEGHLRGRKDVIARISTVVDRMKLAVLKSNSQERLKKIQINSGIKPFTYVQ